MNPDSITKLTAGLFDGIKNMKSVKNYSYDKSNDLSAKSLMNKKYDNLNQVKIDKSIPIVSDEDSPLYKYPKKEIKEYQDEILNKQNQVAWTMLYYILKEEYNIVILNE